MVEAQNTLTLTVKAEHQFYRWLVYSVTGHIQLCIVLLQTMDREGYNGEHLGQIVLDTDERQLLHWLGLRVEQESVHQQDHNQWS